MSEERCSSSVFMAFLAGGLVGAGLALLYAPGSGRETREKITGLAEEIRKKSQTLSGDLRHRVEDFIEEERSVIKAAYDAGREAMSKEKARFENPPPSPQ